MIPYWLNIGCKLLLLPSKCEIILVPFKNSRFSNIATPKKGANKIDNFKRSNREKNNIGKMNDWMAP